jgi:hypothetical protein
LQSQSDVTLVIGESDTSGNNYETLQHRQHEFVSWALEQARGSYSWLFHIDADELLHGDLSFIHTLPNKIKCLHMQNVEAVYDQANNDTCFSAKQFLKCAHGAPCKSYANGKGAGRVEHMVEPYGPHMFTYTKEGASNFNYDVPFDTLRVLHFDACSFGSWAEKFYHLGKQQRSDIPFPYYNESIDASTRAFDVYQRHKMNSSDVDKSHMWIREYFTQS